MLVLTYCNKIDRKLPELLRSLEGKVPYECHIVSGEFTWDKVVQWQLEMTLRYATETLIFVDAYDTLFVGDPSRLEELVSGEDIVYCADKRCWPDETLSHRFPDVDSPWRYLNGSVMAGKGAKIHNAIQLGLATAPIKPMVNDGRSIYYQDNDQRFWIDVYLRGRGGLDTECQVFQNLSAIEDSDFRVKRGRFYNTVTGTYPQFIHAAAKTWWLIPKELL